MGSPKIRRRAAVSVILSLIILCFSIVPASAVSSAYQTGTVVNCASSVNVRIGPGTGYKLLGTAPKGAAYTVYGKSGSWYKIDYNGKIGYVYYTYLSVSSSPQESAPSQTGTVVNCVKSVNVRSGPGAGYKLLGTAPKGASYAVTGKSGSWYAVLYNGKTGYINSEYLSVTISSPAPTATPSPTATPTQTPAPSGEVMYGYYASWAAYSGFTPLKIQADKLNFVTYAFANIDDNLNVEMGDPDIDPTNFAQLNQLKANNHGLKTLISVGGWDWSGKFSDAALTDASREAFADSAVAFMKKYGFDGVDIDWEYPVSNGLSTNTVRPQDKTDFTLLMAALREKLDAQGALDGCHYLLTFAGASGDLYANNTELSKLAGYADYATVMTYDMHGAWTGSYTDFNSPLYTPTENSPQYKWSCDDAVKLWTSNGFPKSKILMGVPFYGIEYSGVKNANKGLYQTFSSGGSVSYDKIVSSYLKNTAYKRYVHSTAQVPWLFNGSTFVSYDDASSISQKASYIKNSGLAGAGIWELSQNTDGTLLSALYNNLK